MLKLAVSYRLVTNLGVDKEIADNEEFRLIKEIVKRIVKEYNFFRKELQMSYNEEELENGIITIKGLSRVFPKFCVKSRQL